MTKEMLEMPSVLAAYHWDTVKNPEKNGKSKDTDHHTSINSRTGLRIRSGLLSWRNVRC